MLSFLQRFVFLVLFTLISSPIHSEEGGDYLDHFLDGLDTFKGNFKQTLINAKGDTVERTSGILYIHNPGQFHWAYKEPYVQSIISDGATLWIYDEDIEQLTIKSISGEMDSTPAAILSGSENLADHFEIIDKGQIEGIFIVELNPLNEENQFHSIQLGFYGRYLTMMMMFDKLGQITRVNFSETIRNETLDEALFHFVPPEGTDIIDGREQLTENL